MSVFKRLVRLCKADLHGLMDALEDKELLLKQCLREMEEELERARERRALLLAERRRCAAEADRARCRLERVEADLDLAVNAQRDDVCRSLIKQRRLLLGQWDALASRLADFDARAAAANERIQYEEAALDELRLRVAAHAQQAQHEKALAEDLDYVEPLAARERVVRQDLAQDTSLDTGLDPSIELELLQLKQRAAHNALTGLDAQTGADAHAQAAA